MHDLALAAIGAVCIFCVLSEATLSASDWRYLGAINISNPSFLAACPRPCSGGGACEGTVDFWVSQFSGFSKDSGKVSVIPGIERYLNDVNGTRPITLERSFLWPNELSLAPEGALPIEYGIVVPNGFLVPDMDTGSIQIMSCKSSDATMACDAPVKITTDKQGYFYHSVKWTDVNKDGRLDMVTARGTKPSSGAGVGELLWLQQPATDPLQGLPWAEHLITSGPDFFFELDTESEHGVWRLYAAEFFASALMLYRFNVTQDVVEMASTTLVDSSIGPLYKVELVDLDGDGQRELLVTNHQSGLGGGVFAYEVPLDVVTQPGFGQASPGPAYTFRPHANSTGPVWIGVAGDGAQQAYVLVPNPYVLGGKSGFRTTYTMKSLAYVGGTVGTLAVGDFLGGGDGWTDIAVSDYDQGYILFYTFAPQ